MASNSFRLPWIFHGKTIEGDDTVAALPNLDELLTDLHLTQLTTDLIQLSKAFFMSLLLFCVTSGAFTPR